MDQDELFRQWRDAAGSGSLLIPKHDPNNTITYSSYRTVLTQEMSGSLRNFIYSGNYTVNHYSDSDYPYGAGYFEIIPDRSSGFSVVGSQIPSGSMTPRGQLDRLILVSGSRSGWHLHAESSQEISGSIVSGRFTLIETIHPE